MQDSPRGSIRKIVEAMGGKSNGKDGERKQGKAIEERRTQRATCSCMSTNSFIVLSPKRGFKGLNEDVKPRSLSKDTQV